LYCTIVDPTTTTAFFHFENIPHESSVSIVGSVGGLAVSIGSHQLVWIDESSGTTFGNPDNAVVDDDIDHCTNT
jgi:hypothetical protein